LEIILVTINLYAQVLQALETFKRQYKKAFTLTHCYRALKDQQKWKALYASLKNGGQPLDKGEDTTEKEGRPRGKNNSKAELKRDATTLALQETLNGFLTQKDKAADKKEERREKERLERETASKLFFELQKKRLDIEEENARTRAREADARAKEAEARAMEAEAKAKDIELALRQEEARIMDMDLSAFTPTKKAYYLKKQRYYMDRD
jgi:hypothetical protein